MNTIHFHKYQATGNDFVLIDNRAGKYSFTKDQIAKVCDRRFGVGADGLLLIEKHPSFDFNLVYYNSDGSQSLCGNGSRAAVMMASSLGMLNGKTIFNAYDGSHEAEVLPNGIIRLKMNNVKAVKMMGEDIFINTGSPHFIRFVKKLEGYPVLEEGRKIRYSEAYSPHGANANFVELQNDNSIFVRTYERGVEDETLSCGTGVTAAALAASLKGYRSPVVVKVLGGELSVEFKTGELNALAEQAGIKAEINNPSATNTGIFHDIFLIGPAKMVFEGDLEL
ncbi:MAG: diaminopimelate epimerase [Bacteroidia bacterium]|nr:diaminopimelate epimerase [Bacteroidia bacterium]